LLPPGFQPGEPPPPGFEFPPGTQFPPIVTPGSPPIYIPPWEPGPPKTGGPGGGGAAPVEVTILSSSSDGWIRGYGGTWDAARSDVTGNQVSAAQADESNAISGYYSSGYHVRRTFLSFDLSALPASGKTVTSVIVGVTGMHANNTDVTIQKGTQHDPLEVDDILAFEGSPFTSLTWKKYISPDLNTNTFTLNAAGIAYIQSVMGGTAKFCLREKDHDYDDVSPPGASSQNGMAYSEYPTETFKPYITVTYQ